MAQVVLVNDERITVGLDEAVAAVKRALPLDHPAIKALETEAEAAGVALSDVEIERDRAHEEASQARGLLRLVEALEDWARGIRDWCEVADVLKDARKYVDKVAV